MYKRQFIFAPNKVNLLDKDLYDEISYEGNLAYLTLKKNVKIGYANSFSDAMYSIDDMAQYFISDSIEEITLSNGFMVLKGKGRNSAETVMDLTCAFFNYSLPDTMKVTIEVKGTLNPKKFIPIGEFAGLFEEGTHFDGEYIVSEFFSSVSGHPLDSISTDFKKVYRSNMVTSFIVKKDAHHFSAEVRYITVDCITGDMNKSTIFSFPSEEKLLAYLSEKGKYSNLIESSLLFSQ